MKAEFNDLDAPINQEAYDELISAGIDPLLAKHIAHLFIRDPLVIYDNRIELDATQNSDHFEVCVLPLYSPKVSLNSLLSIRIFNLRTGKQSDLSPLLLTRLLVGGKSYFCFILLEWALIPS